MKHKWQINLPQEKFRNTKQRFKPKFILPTLNKTEKS